MLMGYDGLQSHELRDNVEAIAPPSAQDVCTSICGRNFYMNSSTAKKSS